MSALTRLNPRPRHALDEILAAEQRIDAGVFGLCERCHRPISLRRLRAAPTTRLCLRCSKATSRVGRRRMAAPSTRAPSSLTRPRR
jgi:RNA polymerase-binding transcription factor DksA